jgi:hypothetical protein
MTRSAYAVTSSLTVACPTCWAEVGAHCHVYTRGAKVKAARSHSSRRKAADTLRTQEVNPNLVDTHEIPPEIHVDPDRHAVQRIPDLCPDESKDGSAVLVVVPLGNNMKAGYGVYHEAMRMLDAEILRSAAGNNEPHNAETCRDPACDCYPF